MTRLKLTLVHAKEYFVLRMWIMNLSIEMRCQIMPTFKVTALRLPKFAATWSFGRTHNQWRQITPLPPFKNSVSQQNTSSEEPCEMTANEWWLQCYNSVYIWQLFYSAKNHSGSLLRLPLRWRVKPNADPNFRTTATVLLHSETCAAPFYVW